MMKKILLTLLIILSSTAFANMNVYQFDDSGEKARFDDLITELRCPKCQNNNLADSNAPLATDIKNYVYQSITNNRSDSEIREFLISRYGEFVTYKPPFVGVNILIWVLPFVFALVGLIFAIRVIRLKKKQPNNPTPLEPMKSIINDYEQQNQSGDKR